MAFTAKLLKAEKSDSGWKIEVEFTDGSDISVRKFRFSGSTDEQLIGFIRNQAASLDTIKNSDFSIHVGKEIDLTETIETPAEPTVEEIAKSEWFDDWRKLDSFKHLANNGLIEQTDIRIINLQTSLIAGWLNSYLGDI